MTDRTIRKTDELWKSQQERVQVLEDQIHELMEMNDQLEAEVFSLRKMGASEEGANIILLCSVLFCGCVFCVLFVSDGGQSGVLRQQVKDLKDERVILKSSVHRLNVELSRYQAKFRPLKPSEVSPRSCPHSCVFVYFFCESFFFFCS